MDVLMPQLGETVAEGTVSAWHKQVGDRVAADELLLDVETDKVSMEIPAPGSGVIKEIRVEAGQTVKVGTVLAVIESEGESVQPAPPPPAAEAAPAPSAPLLAAAPPRPGAAPAPRSAQARLSPAVRRIVAEHNIDVAAVRGTGRDGRITRGDVLELVDAQADNAAPPAARVEAPARDENVVPFNRIRRLTAEHMVRSKATSAHVLQAVEVDFSRVDRLRRRLRETWRDKHGYSLTYLPFIAHAVSSALREFPNANASVEGDRLVLHPHVNLAIAVDLGPEGLIAPVIRNAERLTIAELAEAIHDRAVRARDNGLKPDDLSGGTYTLTNNGSFGTLITAPIINQPQVAILSVDGVRKRPVVVEHAEGDTIAIRPIGILAQSFDHRAIDGAYSAAFLAKVRTLLEQSDWQVEP